MLVSCLIPGKYNALVSMCVIVRVARGRGARGVKSVPRRNVSATVLAVGVGSIYRNGYNVAHNSLSVIT